MSLYEHQTVNYTASAHSEPFNARLPSRAGKFPPLLKRTSPRPWALPDPPRDPGKPPVSYAYRSYPSLFMLGIGEAFIAGIPNGTAPERIRGSVNQAIRTHRKSRDGQGKVFEVGRVEGGYRVTRVK